MTTIPWNPLLDTPPYSASGYGKLADRLGALLHTKNDMLLVQGEAIIALEAVASSIARPGLTRINIVTSPYGRWFGDWLRRGGADVTDVVAAPGLPMTAEAVASALGARERTDIITLVHAESATGILNPLAEIVALARECGAIVVLDAVASFGGHALDVDGLGIDIAVIGPQKSLGGSAGVSAISISPKAWALAEAAGKPLVSTLSLLDLKRNWLDRGRGAVPGMPFALEFHALTAALDRVEAEGPSAMVDRHALAATATRKGVVALGLEPWVPAASASNLVTGVALPEGLDIEAVLGRADRFCTGIARGVGDGAERLLRLNHTGPRARFDTVLANVLALGGALRDAGHGADIGAAAEAVVARYGAGG